MAWRVVRGTDNRDDNQRPTAARRDQRHTTGLGRQTMCLQSCGRVSTPRWIAHRRLHPNQEPINRKRHFEQACCDPIFPALPRSVKLLRDDAHSHAIA